MCAAALYRRATLVGTEYFDSTFFAYLEDVDLDWRVRLRGWKACYVPTAVAEHERGHKGCRRGQGAAVIRHSLKNRYLMMVRNDRPTDVLPYLGSIVVTEALRFLDYGHSRPAALSGYVHMLRALPRAMAARRQIQGRWVVDRATLRGWLEPYPFVRKLRRRLAGDVAIDGRRDGVNPSRHASRSSGLTTGRASQSSAREP